MTETETREFALTTVRVAWMVVIAIFAYALTVTGVLPGGAAHVVIAGAAYDVVRYVAWDVPRYVKTEAETIGEPEAEMVPADAEEVETVDEMVDEAYREDERRTAERVYD